MKIFQLNVQLKLLSKLAITCLLLTAGWLTFIGCAPEVMDPVSKKAGDDKIADGGTPTPDDTPDPVIIPTTSIYVAVGDSGKIALSKDLGASWAAVNSGTMGNLSDIATDGSNFIAVANTGVVVKSIDGGENWAVVSSTGISSSTVAEIEYGNDVFVIFTYKGGSTPYALYRSTDGGTTWATSTLATGLFTAGTNSISLAYANNRFIAARGIAGEGRIAVSTDGFNYTNGLGSGSVRFGAVSPVKVRVVNDRYFVLNNATIPVAVGDTTSTSSAIYHASTGSWGASPWTLIIRNSSSRDQTLPSVTATETPIDVAHSPSANVYAFISRVGNGSNPPGVVMTSPTVAGGSFALQTSSRINNVKRIIFFNGKFLVAGGSGKMLTSDAMGDAGDVTWTEAMSGTTADLLEGEATANRIVFVGTSGKIIVSSDGTTWEEKSAAGNTTQYNRLVLIE